ncbi:hypothetical protein RSAG8_12103, partial [Rhizoctonia solani AG-8 WAC10335]
MLTLSSIYRHWMRNSPSLYSIRASSAAQSRASILLSPPLTSTALGTVPGAARYDTPPPGAEVEELERSQRIRKPTERGATWQLEDLFETLQNGQATQSATQEWQTQTQTVVHPPEALNIGGGFHLTAISGNPGRPDLGLSPLANPRKRGYSAEDGENTETEDEEESTINISNSSTRGVSPYCHFPLANPRKRGYSAEDGENTETEDEEESTINISNSSTHVAISASSNLAHTAPVPGLSYHLPTAPQSTQIPGSSILGRPIGLPRSSVNTSAASRSPALPSSSTCASAEVEVEGVPSSVSPSPAPETALPTPSSSSSTLVPRVASIPDAPNVNNTGSIVNYCLSLASKQLSSDRASTRATPQQQQVLSAIEGLRQQLLNHGAFTNANPPSMTVPAALSPFPPYPGMSPPTFVPPPPDVVEDNEETLMTLAAATAGKRATSKPSLRDYTGTMRQNITGGMADFLAYILAEFVPPPPDVVEDNEETLMTLAAATAGKRATSKPSLRDYTGTMRQNITGGMADFLAYILAEGAYETKRTQLVWALEACRRESERSSNGPFQIPPLDALKLIVARAPTLRFGGKERTRQLIPHFVGSMNNMSNNFSQLVFMLKIPLVHEAQRRFNEQHVQQLLPIGFHAQDPSRPRVDQYQHAIVQRAVALIGFHSPDSVGATFYEYFNPMPLPTQYQHAIVQRAVALIGFHSPDSVGATFYEYFNPMPLPTVAFALTTVQFCIEEWETGVFKAKELRAERQYNTYCAHLKGLQQYESVAVSRMARFRREWFEFAIQYSGITIPTQAPVQETTEAEDVRPDTPPPSPDL